MRVTQVILLLICFNLGMAFVILVRLLLTDLDAQTFQATEEVMVDTSKRFAQLVEAELDTGGVLSAELCDHVFPEVNSEHDAEVSIYNLKKTTVGLHHYIVNKQGIVIYDSQPEHYQQMNFSAYNDVLLTLKGEYGARSSRMDEDDSTSSFLYVGAPIKKDGEIIGVLSLYKAQSDVLPFIYKRRRQILQVCIFMGVGTVLFVVAVFFLVYRPIGQLTVYAQGVIDGQRPSFPKLGKGREINTLGRALKQMRETLEGRDYAENYVQTLSHELKSPISAIKANAELLQEEMPQEQRGKFLKSIVTQAERSEKTISRLQQLSQIEKMTELERYEELSVGEIIDHLVADYEGVSYDVTFITNVISGSILGDPFLIRAVFQNLIDNAVKFSPADAKVGVRMNMSTETLTVEVSNEGAAIPEYARERIFERLFSLGDRVSGKGSGVGLALAKEALVLHGGDVMYSYESGRNVFQATLPAVSKC